MKEEMTPLLCSCCANCEDHCTCCASCDGIIIAVGECGQCKGEKERTDSDVPY